MPIDIRECETCGGLFSPQNGQLGDQCPACSSPPESVSHEQLPQFIGGIPANQVSCTKCNGTMLMAFDVYLANCPHCNALVWKRPDVFVTTGNEIPGHRIAAILDVVTAERAIGMHVFQDMMVELRDIFGGRSGTTEQTLRQLRQHCMQCLKAEARRIGGNAVMGVDLDYSEFSGKGMTMLFLVASGTVAYVVPNAS